MKFRLSFPVLLFLGFVCGCSKSSSVPPSGVPTPGSAFPVHSTNLNTRLGHAYEFGEGVPVNLRVALAYFEKGAREQDPEAQYRLGYVLEFSENRDLRDQGIVLYTLAAEKGHAEAAYSLGYMFHSEKRQPENRLKALNWYRKAADRGSAKACTRLGEMYSAGFGVPQDPGKAVEWYKEGAARGDPLSMKKLYYMALAGHVPPESGTGVVNNAEHEADYWFYRSYLAGECQNAFYVKDLDWNPNLLKAFKERARRDLGPDVTLEREGSWRIHPVEKPDTPRYWALATSALLVEMNYGQHERLGTFSRDDEQRRQNIAWLMFNTWGVSCREDLLEKLEGLRSRGTRSRFDEIHSALEAEKQGDQQPIQRLRRHGVSDYRIDIVRKEADRLKGKSLLGFDYSRYVTLCRWGYLVGYLSEQEAWALIMPAARTLRHTFESWEDLSNNYLIGRRFLSVALTTEDGDAFRERAAYMLINRNYPWCECRWEVDIPE